MVKIVVATSQRNPIFVQFHVREPLVAGKNQEFFLPLKRTSETYLDELTQNGKELVLRLSRVAGVTRIAVNLHALSLHTSPAFELAEITSQVLEVIKTVLGYDSTVVVEETTMQALYGT